MVKQKLTRYVMLGERNKSRIKKQTKQYDIEEFVCDVFGGAIVKPVLPNFPKISIWDVITGKYFEKVQKFRMSTLDNEYYVRRKILISAINKIIDEDK